MARVETQKMTAGGGLPALQNDVVRKGSDVNYVNDTVKVSFDVNYVSNVISGQTMPEGPVPAFFGFPKYFAVSVHLPWSVALPSVAREGRGFGPRHWALIGGPDRWPRRLWSVQVLKRSFWLPFQHQVDCSTKETTASHQLPAQNAKVQMKKAGEERRQKT